MSTAKKKTTVAKKKAPVKTKPEETAVEDKQPETA